TGRSRPTRACCTCGREVARYGFGAADLRPHGRPPLRTLHIPDWCGCTTEYIPVPASGRLMGSHPDLGSRSDGEPAAAVRAARATVTTQEKLMRLILWWSWVLAITSSLTVSGSIANGQPLARLTRGQVEEMLRGNKPLTRPCQEVCK